MNPNTQTPPDGETAEDAGAMRAVGVDDTANQNSAVDITPIPGSCPAVPNDGAEAAADENIVVEPLVDHYTVEGGSNGAVGEGVQMMDPPNYTRPNMGQSPEFAVTLWVALETDLLKSQQGM